MSRPPGTRRQTPGKATRGPGGDKRPAADSRGACPTSISGTDISTAGIFGTGIPRTDISAAGIVRTDIPADTSLLTVPAGSYPASSPAGTFRQKSDSSHKGKNRFFHMARSNRDKPPRQGANPKTRGDSPAPADGYSYCPDLRRSTSSRVRKRQAPRLRFFLVRPA